MRHVLVVANQTLGGKELLAAVAERVEQGPCRFVLAVPAGATPALQNVNDMSLGAGYGSLTTDATLAAAHERLEQGLESLRATGAAVEGCVVPHDPVHALRDIHKRVGFDEIIISTLPHGVSRWLHLDVPHRVERACHVPVTVVTASTTPAHA